MLNVIFCYQYGFRPFFIGAVTYDEVFCKNVRKGKYIFYYTKIDLNRVILSRSKIKTHLFEPHRHIDHIGYMISVLPLTFFSETGILRQGTPGKAFKGRQNIYFVTLGILPALTLYVKIAEILFCTCTGAMELTAFTGITAFCGNRIPLNAGLPARLQLILNG